MSKKNKNQHPQLHDSFFKEVFSDKAKAEDFLKGSLPKDVVKRIDFQYLKLMNGSFVDEKLRPHFSDLVYECVWDGEQKIKLAFLFEHKSDVPKFPHLQLLRYMLRLWETQEKNKQSLQPIIPIILYHGKKKWDLKDFSSYFPPGKISPELKSFIPEFQYCLKDLEADSVAQIQEDFKLHSVQMALKLMKFIFSPNIIDHLPLIFKDLREFVKGAEGRRDYDVFLLYLFRGTDDSLTDEIKEVMKSFLEMEPPKGSVAWRLEENAKINAKLQLKGEEIGERTKAEEVARNLHNEGLPLDLISRATGLEVDDLKNILKL